MCSHSHPFSSDHQTLKLSVLYRSDSATPEPETDTDESKDEILDLGHDCLVRRSKSDKVGSVVVCRRSSSSCGSSSSSLIYFGFGGGFIFLFFLAVGCGCHIEVVASGVVVEVDVAG